jgi:hypothetical protein
MILILLAGCCGPEAQIPREALNPLPDITLPKEPVLHTTKLLDDQGKPAGLLFPTNDAFTEAQYRNDLREAAELGAANTRAANKIFGILREPPKKWWQFWRRKTEAEVSK